MRVMQVSRRDFMKISSAASAGLILGVSIPSKAQNRNVTADLNSFVQVGTDGIVTIWVSKSDMGQDVRTALPMIVAEELDADWTKVRIRQAHLDKKFGRMGTGGSSSIRTMWTPLRQAGATARAMLVSAAAFAWGVDASQIVVKNGVLSHGANKATFGELAEAAARVVLSGEVKLKDPKDFRLLGKPTKRLDTTDIVTGRAGYGIDAIVPGMLYASVLRSPVFGGKVASFDATKAKAIAGVKHVVPIEAKGTDLPWSGVAVVANSTWAAMQGREALEVKWDAGAAASESTESLGKHLAEIVDSGKQVIARGDVAAALASAAKKIDATYDLPYLAHAAMEPLGATASVTADGVEFWAGTQFPDWGGGTGAGMVGLKPEQTKVNVTMLGGGFGRRANPDFMAEAAVISKAVGAPVKVQWTREDDMQHDYYRPRSHHRITAGIDAENNVVAWHHRIAAPSIEAYLTPKTEKPHESEIGGIEDMPYAIPNFRADFALAQSAVPRGWWRSVEYSINGFVLNAFLDELAQATGRDPIDLQLALIPKGFVETDLPAYAKAWPYASDRLRGVIELVRQKSNWDKPLPAGRARGFGAQHSFHSYAAQVAEVSIVDGAPQVHRIVCAIDCGIPLNPDGIRAQVEGGIVYGLSAALHGAITIDKGRVQESNFHDYPLLTIAQMPQIEVHIVPSTAAPTGTGEPGLPPAAAAVANAVSRLTGKRVRSLPIRV
jgi:isoquinoline 1-oxidoreductase subunit beta